MNKKPGNSDANNRRAPCEYRTNPGEAIAGTTEALFQRIREKGAISFAEYMATVLYSPGFGYYSRQTRQVGRRGDFFTSVSAGSLFGKLLASRFVDWWRAAKEPKKWRVLELGAHDGTLAADVLSQVKALAPGAFATLEYVIIEPLKTLEAAQKAALSSFTGHFSVHSSAATLAPCPTFLFANEVLDALPFQVIESNGTGWQEIGVALDASDNLVWKNLGSAELIAKQVPLRHAGYRTEVRPQFGEFLKPLFAAVSAGSRMLWIDYGFDAVDYYHPGRNQGTLRTYSNHRAGGDPLQTPGEIDITAHVDFTALTAAASKFGGQLVVQENQARYLTRLARPWLISIDGQTDDETVKSLRNFQTLTHPAQLGSGFHFLEYLVK